VDTIIEDVYQLLKPGGKFISMEYFDFDHISMYPQKASFDLVFEKVKELLTKSGGDADIGGKLYHMMKSAGFKNIEVIPLYKTGKANSELWKWLEQTNENHTNLVQNNLISEDELQTFYSDWNENAECDQSFISAPPLMITIGEK